MGQDVKEDVVGGQRVLSGNHGNMGGLGMCRGGGGLALLISRDQKVNRFNLNRVI